MISLFIALSMPIQMKPLTVTSFNVRYGTANDGPNKWELRRPLALGIIQKHPADILCVQEALDFQVDEFASAFSFGKVGVGRDDGKKVGEFSAILYDRKRLKVLDSGTFWLSDTPEVVASKHWGNNVIRICTWVLFEDIRSREMFRVFNTHFDHESQPSREKSAELILKRVAGPSPVIVTGDFNAGETNPAAKALAAGGFRDTWRVLYPTAPEPGTFSGFKELGTAKIDYVWVDKSWNVKSAVIITEKIGGMWPSDHTPVTATVELR